jgi:hypothetical protein
VSSLTEFLNNNQSVENQSQNNLNSIKENT